MILGPMILGDDNAWHAGASLWSLRSWPRVLSTTSWTVAVSVSDNDCLLINFWYGRGGYVLYLGCTSITPIFELNCTQRCALQQPEAPIGRELCVANNKKREGDPSVAPVMERHNSRYWTHAVFACCLLTRVYIFEWLCFSHACNWLTAPADGLAVYPKEQRVAEGCVPVETDSSNVSCTHHMHTPTNHFS